MNDKVTTAKLISVITALSVACIAMILTIAMLTYFLMQKKVQGYAVSDNGRIIPVVNLDQPYVTDARVTGFVDECLRRSFSHDFENFRITMEDAKKCFTVAGAEEYEAAMGSLIKDIKEKSLVLSASLEPTVVTRVYKLNGVVFWETQTQIVIFRRGSRENISPLKYRVESVIQRVPLDQNVRGISLKTINLKPI